MKIPLSFAAIEIFLVLCDAYAPVSKGNNYLQLLRAQKFMQIQTQHSIPNPKLFQNYSEDLDELDAYEEEPELVKEENGNNQTRKEQLEFKNVETLMKKNDQEYDVEKRIASGRACTISEKGNLDVSIHEENIFNLKNYVVQIAASSIIISENEPNGNIIKTVPFESIKLPIETIDETRECWKVKTSEQNILFCEKNKNERDIWIHNILKALFCYNTNNLKIEKNLFEKSETLELPKESTVEKRIQEKRNNTKIQNKNHHNHSKSSYNNKDYVSEDISDFDLDINE